MITVAQLKYYLKLNDTGLESQEVIDRDEFLKTCIELGRSELDTILNRKLERDSYTEIIRRNNSRTDIYFKNAPIISVESLKYWSGDVYTDLFTAPEEISDNIEIMEYYILVRNRCVLHKDLQAEYIAGYIFEPLSGTVSGSIGTKTVAGTGTAFDTELAVGDEIVIEGERRKVASITNATTLAVDINLSKNYTAVAGYLNTYPADLSKACLNLATYIFLESRQGEGSLNKSSANINIGGAVADNYKPLNLSTVISKYEIKNL